MKFGFILGAVLLVSAFAQASTYTPTYSCFNRAQQTDGPIISIVMNENYAQFVKVETKGGARLIPLELVTVGTGEAIYKGTGVIVTFAERVGGGENDTASVRIGSLGLTYTCSVLVFNN
jgi:hypothetical protein